MCTAATYKTKDFYFGRNLDYEFSYGDTITITPRNYVFKFRNIEDIKSHYAILGTACIMDDYPLYYDAINEKGLCIAGLNFVGNACYKEIEEGKENIAQFELIPWLLGQCSTVHEVRELIINLNITNQTFKAGLPASQLHWLIADSTECITMEALKDGIKIYDNPVGVLTNNPPFDKQLFNLNNYMGISIDNPENSFAPGVDLQTYSRGMGGLGLPGDLSSMSRFVKVAFTRMNSKSGDSEMESVSQFFHILGSVEQQKGCCHLGEDKYEFTLYTSCYNANKGIYYYTTYNNHQISAVDMYKADLNSSELIGFTPIEEEQFNWHN